MRGAIDNEPDLWTLLAIPSPPDHVVSRRHSRHLDLVDDGHVGVLVAAALAVRQRRARPGARAVGQVGLRVVPALVARVREADVARLVPPAVLVCATVGAASGLVAGGGPRAK